MNLSVNFLDLHVFSFSFTSDFYAWMHAGDDGTYTDTYYGTSPLVYFIFYMILIFMGGTAALALCGGLGWYWVVRSERAKEEEQAAWQEAAAVGEHKNTAYPVMMNGNQT
jgi:hypothetical protein